MSNGSIDKETQGWKTPNELYRGATRRGQQVGTVCLMFLAVLVGALKTATIFQDHHKDIATQTERSLQATTTKKCFDNSTELRLKVDAYIRNNRSDSDIAKTYGWPIGKWCVSNIQDFSKLFSYYRNPVTARFNEDISEWDTSNAVDMSKMFAGKYLDKSYAFNRDISAWNVGKVTRMVSMFYNAYNFNQPLSAWDVSSVTSMSYMFGKTYKFNQDLSTWDVSSVTDMTGMFFYAKAFNGNISPWKVSTVSKTKNMFLRAIAFNQNLASWDVSKVADATYMFSNAQVFQQNLCSWGPKLKATSAVVEDMFDKTSCPRNGAADDPKLSASPPGPFCYPCT